MLLYFFVVAGLLIWGASLAWRWREVKAFAPDVLAAKKRDKVLWLDTRLMPVMAGTTGSRRK